MTWGLRTLDVLAEGPDSVPSTHMKDEQQTITPIPGDLTLSSALHRYKAHTHGIPTNM